MRLIKAKEFADLLGVSRTTLWRYEKEGIIPSRRILNKYASVWIESEVLKWINEAPSATSNTDQKVTQKSNSTDITNTVQDGLNALRAKRSTRK